MAPASSCGFNIRINSLNLPAVAKMLGKTQRVLHNFFQMIPSVFWTAVRIKAITDLYRLYINYQLHALIIICS